jgi:hypothetical protein
LAYLNQFTNVVTRTVLVCRKLYGAGSKCNQITLNPNNLSKTHLQSYVCHYFEAVRFSLS